MRGASLVSQPLPHGSTRSPSPFRGGGLARETGGGLFYKPDVLCDKSSPIIHYILYIGAYTAPELERSWRASVKSISISVRI